MPATRLMLMATSANIRDNAVLQRRWGVPLLAKAPGGQG